jgi:hypothetical protein
MSASAAPDTHLCPGCEDVLVEAGRLSCPPCWFRLPKDIRDRINDAWKATRRHAPGAYRAHREAVLLALRWYHINPRKDAR